MADKTLIINANVLTMDDANPKAEAIYIENGRIAAIGSNVQFRSLSHWESEIIDLKGQTIIPGFIDCHTHFFQLGLKRLQLDLRGTQSLEEAALKVKERSSELGKGAWVVGNRWDDSKWKENRYITRADLDRFAPDNPVLLRRICEHVWVANTAALKVSQIPEDYPGLEAKEGILRRDSKNYMLKFIEPSKDEMKKAIDLAVNEALSCGVTSVHEWETSFSVFQKAQQEGRLHVRVYLCPREKNLQNVIALGLKPGYGNSYLRLGAIKAFADGSIGARTARLNEPYADEPQNFGSYYIEPSELKNLIKTAHDNELQVAVHAIGDQAIVSLLDTYESALKTNPRIDHRHRIEHCELINDELIKRIAELQLIVSAQPNFVGEWGGEGELYEIRLGKERLKNMNPFGKLKAAGAVLAFGSDCMPFGPLYGIWSAVNHPNEENRLSPYEAIKHYTYWGAYCEFEERNKGKIAPNMYADLAVLADDPTAVKPEKIKDIRVEMTFVDGKCLFTGDNND